MNMKELGNALVESGNTEYDARLCHDVMEDLLKTHAIVPRKIPRETLLEIQSKQPCTIRKMIELFIEISERGDD